MSKSLEIRGSWKQVVLGKIIAIFVKSLGMTLRFEVEDPHGVKAGLVSDTPGVWVFWHGNLLTGPLFMKRYLGEMKASTLTSASRDGAIIESFTACFGVKSVRGSTSRRAVAALIALKRALKNGSHVFVTPDGPRGPRYNLEPGVVKLAESSSCPLFPVRFSYSSSWRVKTWDRLHIPKPFSTVKVYLAAPVTVSGKLNENDFESTRKILEDILREGIDDLPNIKTT